MNKELNLKIFEKSYKSLAAKNGLRVLKRLIYTRDEYSLKELLRSHKEKDIKYFIEKEFRDNIDDLLEYYSLLEIGILAGYFPQSLNKTIANELEIVLGNQHVQEYFINHYPLFLVQLLIYKNRNQIDIIENEDSALKNEYLFEKFILINTSIKTDKDVDQFLWFLDDGKTDNFSINNFWEVLEDVNRIEYKLNSTVSHPLNHCLWGFIKYLQFLQDYANLLRETYKSELLQSSFWHYQSYWFEHMENRLGEIIEKGTKNIINAMQRSSYSNLANNYNSYISSDNEYVNWKESISALYNIEQDITFLSSKEIKMPILRELKYYS